MRLFFDIETSPNVAYVWKTGWKLSVNTHAIVEERAVICICWRWENQKRVHHLHWTAPGDDKAMLKAFCEVVSQASEVVAHNGDHFDLPWLRGRCLKHGLVFPTVPSVDTCLQARRLFSLNSNALDYLAHYLKLGGKSHTNFALWRDCMNGKRKALNQMVAYCKQDVVVLEAVFQRLKPYLTTRVHAGVEAGGLRVDCPNCGSVKTKLDKRRATAAGLIRVQLKCSGCGKYFTMAESSFIREIAKRN